LSIQNENEQAYTYSKLRARAVELGLTSREVAAAIRMNASTYSIKLNGKGEFSQSEIRKICKVLLIESADIPMYFFTERV